MTNNGIAASTYSTSEGANASPSEISRNILQIRGLLDADFDNAAKCKLVLQQCDLAHASAQRGHVERAALQLRKASQDGHLEAAPQIRERRTLAPARGQRCAIREQ